MKALSRFSDRLVNRLVPKAAAHADECQWVYDCKARSSCSSNYGKYRKYYCVSGHNSTWQYLGCC